MSEKSKENSIPIETMVTIAIAIIAFAGAMTGIISGGRARQIAIFEKKAIAASINREQAYVIAHTWMLQDLRAYAEYNRLNDLATITEAEAEMAFARGDEERADVLQEKVQEYRTAANAKATFFSEEYILPGGSFDEESFLTNQMRFESRNLDTNPQKNFEMAQQIIDKSSVLVTGIYLLSFVVVSLIFARVIKSNWRYLWVGVASVILIIDIIYILINEFSFVPV
ncbi:MAG: hypothetical protein ISR58_07650 [Anaerolineales bacterium]|nr:hypothetical protein [Chloroflexota bacterium]MBL6981051.1 hypothetical protein [Anaerolineales bacterium]